MLKACVAKGNLGTDDGIRADCSTSGSRALRLRPLNRFNVSRLAKVKAVPDGDRPMALVPHLRPHTGADPLAFTLIVLPTDCLLSGML